MIALKAVNISKDIYGTDTVPAFEICKGFMKPLERFEANTKS